MTQPSTGEWAGIAAAAVLVLGALGKAAQWLFGWADRRAEGRGMKLQAWHDELAAREAAWDDRVGARLDLLESENVRRVEENNALRLAFELVASALRAIDPLNTALSRAEQLLQTAFPLVPAIPKDMTATLRGVETRDLAAQAAARAEGAA
jgi:hypothetical protein